MSNCHFDAFLSTVIVLYIIRKDDFFGTVTFKIYLLNNLILIYLNLKRINEIKYD
jgi:hypothetical protein